MIFRSAIVLTVLLWAITVPAQQYQIWIDSESGEKYYKWKNDKGQYILSDHPPAATENVEGSPESQEPRPHQGEAPVIGQTPTGKPIYKGPRGGQYHYSKSGNKVYHPRSGTRRSR